MKYNLNDVTFLLLAKFDSIERIENVVMVCDYLVENYDTHICLWEIGSHHNNLYEKLIPSSVNYSFLQDDDPILHRTKYLNLMVEASETDYVAIWDVDVVAPTHQVNDAAELLRNGAEFVYPYEFHFYEVSKLFRDMYFDNRDIEFLVAHKSFMNELYSPHPVGGAFMAKRQSYIDSGLENVNFYGWGIEDGERFLRWSVQHRIIKRVTGCLFHLTHGRGTNSLMHTLEESINKKRILLKAGRGIQWKNS